ncbi:hypothetical protein, partial [Streptomyces sp. NPDC013489]|uniref:hypothetical protein n=1 Tax=Streptomyces sp. NPDC013489 TaxID=3155606 RepID=UPI00340CFD91
AEVETEEEYRKKGELYTEKLSLDAKLFALQEKLAHFRFSQEEIDVLCSLENPEAEKSSRRCSKRP